MIVIIPTAKNPMDLAVLINQLQCQTVLPESIYIADNSEDGYGVKLAKRYQWAVPIYVERNVGTITDSWNAGLNFAEEKDVVILNDDIMVPKNYIETISFYFEINVDCICPFSPGFPPVGHIRQGFRWQADLVPEIHHVGKSSSHQYLPDLTGWCFALSSRLIKKVGTFDPQFKIWYGDRDYQERIYESGYEIAFISNLFVQHFGTSSYSKIDKKVFTSTNYQDQVNYEKKYGLEHQDLGWDQYA